MSSVAIVVLHGLEHKVFLVRGGMNEEFRPIIIMSVRRVDLTMMVWKRKKNGLCVK